MSSHRVNIENAILTTFLDANDLFDDISKVYKLDVDIFTSSFRRRVAESINSVDDGNYGYLGFEIENKVIGTNFFNDYLEMTAQTSLGLGFSKKYHDALVKEMEIEGIL